MTGPRRSSPRLSHYMFPRLVMSADRSLWAEIAQWQREGKVQVTAVSRDSAWVQVTDAGREAIQKLATEEPQS